MARCEYRPCEARLFTLLSGECPPQADHLIRFHLHLKPYVRIPRIRLSCVLNLKAYVTYRAGSAFCRRYLSL